MSSNYASVTPDCLLKGPVGQNGLSGDSASSSHLFNEQTDGQYPHKGSNQPLAFPLREINDGKNQTPPFPNLINQTRPHLAQTPSPLCNGLSNSLHPMFHSPLLCKSETMPPIVQNGGVMALCPPPPSSKSGHVQRRQKVNVQKFSFFEAGDGMYLLIFASVVISWCFFVTGDSFSYICLFNFILSSFGVFHISISAGVSSHLAKWATLNSP